jgi:dTDP-4-amino-4,6-dideoxygalactose transaminase
MPIPLVDLSIMHREIESEVREGFDQLMATGAYVLGPQVSRFEAAYAEFCEVAHCIGVGSGTDALELALRAHEIGAGDEVILPANTFIASALAVRRAGATPVLVDVDPDYLLLDVEKVASRIGKKTRAVMGVDLFGQMPRHEDLEGICEGAGIILVADAAQSQGAVRNGRKAGSFGSIAGTSFYPGKNLGAYGDAGAVVTDNDELADKIRRLRNYGSEIKYHHPEVGFNSRLDSMQAIVLNAKLARLPGWNESRRAAAERYESLLADAAGIETPKTMPGNEHVWHIYAVLVADRDRVLSELHEAGVGAGIHYPVPLHLQGALGDLGHNEGDFPETERAANQMISLPMFPGISEAQQNEVVEALVKAVG